MDGIHSSKAIFYGTQPTLCVFLLVKPFPHHVKPFVLPFLFRLPHLIHRYAPPGNPLSLIVETGTPIVAWMTVKGLYFILNRNICRVNDSR
ncbi:hypothetical protein Sulac_3243 [Sulfobacillus acidophilus DSM 10332]|uniref:Uncharacterized protein n=1 Tax=Sulfobacillus acidophilus (strain ATCC 700253 / DSM 10332 / NAL) TaxID=679936 RepID=G8TSJ7_SULAD|nr:hypothetical protein Sulac_3243 [Sulfobacillus acidophilus DSM 10332]